MVTSSQSVCDAVYDVTGFGGGFPQTGCDMVAKKEKKCWLLRVT